MNKQKITLLSMFFVFLQLNASAQLQKLGKVTDAALSEISGITSSSNQKGYFWVHNDSGDDAQVYLIDSLAKLKVTVKLDAVQVVDCEDISTVIIDGVSYLLLADIGNNQRNRDVLKLYLFPEPKVDFKSKVLHVDSSSIKEIAIKYSDKNRDVEAIFVDQQQQEVYLVSKRDFQSTVFSFPISDFGKKETISLKPKLELPFTFTTAADMSLDGRYIVMKNLTNIYLWERSPNEPVLQTLKKPFKHIPYVVEPQGEAICFAIDGPFFYTISERALGLNSYLYKYKY